MKVTTNLIFIFFLIFLLFLGQSSVEGFNEAEEEVQRSQFPNGFLFGAATSSYQVCLLCFLLLFLLICFCTFVSSDSYPFCRLKEPISKLVKVSATGIFSVVSKVIKSSKCPLHSHISLNGRIN